MADKEVIIFPYINIERGIKMDDSEIHPYKSYSLNWELTSNEEKELDIFVNSFRETFFKKSQSPKVASWIWILKYFWIYFSTFVLFQWPFGTNDGIPVMARPKIRAWISCVPS